MTAYANEALVNSLFEAAATDSEFLERLEGDPSAVFGSVGMLIPPETRADFDAFFRAQTAPLMSTLRSGGTAALTALPSFACSACKIGAWVVAAVIVAVGAAALTSLTVSSPCVVALAGWAGVQAAAALAFIKTLATAVAAGIGMVCLEICTWISACP